MLGFVIGTTFHEFMHAYSALRLGDTTAQRQGRVTLNPVAHFDPLGFGLGVLLMLGIGFIAWGRPVPVNPYALRFGRRGMSIVAVAGPVTNLVFAAVLAPLLAFGAAALSPDVQTVLWYMIYINLALCAFNLIPIPPLDGFNILSGILPTPWVAIMEPIYRNSVPILLGFVFFLPFIGNQLGIPLNPLGAAIRPVLGLLMMAFGLTQYGI
jgi:Zn-dependent protease